MNSAARQIGHHENARPDPLEVFLLRCEVRAELCAAGLHSWQESADVLWEAAEHYGLVRKLGPDRVQEILAAEFARWRDG
jgi:hypothetical protein